MFEQQVPSSVAQRIIIKFLVNEDVATSEIHSRLEAQFSEHCLSQTRVCSLVKSYKEREVCVKNESLVLEPRTSGTSEKVTFKCEPTYIYPESEDIPKAGIRAVKIKETPLNNNERNSLSLMEMTKTLASGHTIEEVTGEEAERLKKYFAFSDGAIRLHPGNWLLPKAYTKYANHIYNFKARSTDIYVSTFPKTGTTWIQEIVWNLVFNPNLDNPEMKTCIDLKFRFFEADLFFAIPGAPPLKPDGDPMKLFTHIYPGMDPSEGVLIHLAAYAPEPRLQKNHLALPLLSPEIFQKSKIIYVARDPRDVIVSYYYFAKLHRIWDFKGTFEEFVDDFINDRMLFGPYWEHMKFAWRKRFHPNFLLIYFENLKSDSKTEIKKVDRFLGTQRTEKQIDNIVSFTTFSQMKERTKENPPTSRDNNLFNKEVAKETGGFYRKGNVGTWKEEFTPELKIKVEAWMKKNLAYFDDDFKYHI